MIYEGKEYPFKVGDKVEITGKFNMEGVIAHIWNKDIAIDCGYIKVTCPPTCLKLVEETPVPKEQIIPLTNPKKTYNLIKQTDTVNSPSHYNQTKIEAIDIIEDVTAGYQSNVKYHIGNAIKYLIRAPFKNNTVEDLKKSVWYIQRAIEKLEGEDK
ncbi:DUF3310 domain-containing protein [Brochothrix thermosphacta]|uniref:DUF3310 domain-containing protein n=1 Tax=Brochothrix thermosphacta TaxID=2756 RepID=UPI001FD2F973|nr:DUF3310 domain-containing protein [Brochothrix thermosphacta]